MEEEEYIRTRISSRAWCDLHPELLNEIAESLGIIDLLGFRGVCKDWRSASFTASASIESTSRDSKLYFLLHNDRDENTILFNPTTNKNYTINIPELKEATCLASTQGWLLISQRGNLFFFCPFSRVKIDLPPIQGLENTPAAAAFTSPPSSIDCVTAIIYKKNDDIVEVNVLERGASMWIKYEYDLKLNQKSFGEAKCATFQQGCLYLMDGFKKLLTFTLEDKSFEMFLVIEQSKDSNLETLSFRYKDKLFSRSNLKKQMNLGDDVTITTCGATYFGSDLEVLIHNENIEAMEGTNAQHFKGIWIQPRFFQLPPNYSWSL
ncbi:F-box protein At4g00893-like [Solanum tuberosum]|uniref:F-box protein At4g00893-like n=1 Tax=Solanum tuberosum TaxID=4113 RepID=UPI0003D28222|nr:PREDICTED: F-box protein At4g00893-like [Solanum tuberosum]